MHKQSIGLLNAAIADELSAIHQYMYFHFHCDDLGYDPLANLFRQLAIEEMLHAERLAERILFLKGDVELGANKEVDKIHDVAGMLKKAKDMEEAAVRMYNDSANKCAAHGDSASKKVFEDLVLDEERHFENFETQEEHLRKFGEQYLALQSMERNRGGGEAGAA